MPAYLLHAGEAAVLVALLCATVGYFVVVRRAAFATHALSQIGFAGAAGAVLVGLEPLVGLVVFTLGGAVVLAVLGRGSRSNDVTTALVLVSALGTGALFLALEHDYASNAFALLFGSIVGVDRGEVALTSVCVVCALVAVAVVARPLLFASVAPDAAAAAGVPAFVLELAFLAIVALTAAVTVPIVGTLLVFSLTLGPVAAAGCLVREPPATIALGCVFAIAAVLAGIALAVTTGWPVGFFVAALACTEYVVARALETRARRRGAPLSHPVEVR